MPQKPPTRAQQSAPAEILASLNLGVNDYTDPTLQSHRQWAVGQNAFSGAFGFVQRARFANLVNAAIGNWVNQSQPFTTLKYYAIPGASSYLLADNNGQFFSFDTGNSYAKTQRFNPYFNPTGSGVADTTPAPSLTGPFSREVLQNIVYEMNGSIKQAGRLANAATIEGFGLDAPDSSAQVTLTSGSSSAISAISRVSTVVTVTVGSTTFLAAQPMVNIVGVTDMSFNGTFTFQILNSTQFTYTQVLSDSSSSGGSANTNITKSVGRSYAWAWENANKNHVSAPSPVTQFIAYNGQFGTIQLTQPGTISATLVIGTPGTVTGTNTLFSSAWIGRSITFGPGGSGTILGRILAVASATSLTILPIASITIASKPFQVYDPQSTHVRLYATADGGATYFRIARNAFTPNSGAPLSFTDTANSEPPNFPFTTEVSQLFNVPPPVGSFLKEYQGRLLIFGGTIPGQTFFYTNIESTTIGLTQESCAPLNQVTLPIQNANISGMADLPGSLIIWSDKQDMFRLTGLLSDNTPLGLGATNTANGLGTSITSLPYNLGCANPFAVVVTPLGAIWVTSNRELWLFTDKYAPRNIGRPIQNILRNIPLNQMANVRLSYYHSLDRNWVSIAMSNGASNNVLANLDLDLLASNGSPSFFTFDMATNHPAFWIFSINCTSMEVVYETGGAVRLLVGSTDLVQDADYQSGLFGTETSVSNGTVVFQPWGNDSAFVIKRPTWLRFTTNQDPSLLAVQGWSFAALGIDDDFYTFASPLTLTLQPGVNDSSTLCGNPNLSSGEAFRHSPEMFRIGGVNFVMGRRIQFVVNFPSGTGVNFALRTIQIGFGASPPR